MPPVDEKLEKLKQFVYDKGKDGAVIAFSGGVDSVTLAAVCHKVLGEKAVAVTAVSFTYTSEEAEEAKKYAREIGIKHLQVKTSELENENFALNPENRCYYCKEELLNRLVEVAKNLGFKAVFEGTNYSDLAGHRPGFKAIEEKANVYSPWAENRFTKEEIRNLAENMVIPVSDKPSLACLASRLPFGERITKDRLFRVESAERKIRGLAGVRQLRVRDHNDLARIEVGSDERGLLFNRELMDRIAEELKKLGFKYVTMDLEGYRTGSMLQTLQGSESP